MLNSMFYGIRVAPRPHSSLLLGWVRFLFYTNSYLSVEKDMNHSLFFLIREQGHWLKALKKSEWFTTLELLWGNALIKVSIIGKSVIFLSIKHA